MSRNAQKGMRIQCSSCGETFRIPADYDRPKGRCPSCGSVIHIRLINADSNTGRKGKVKKNSKAGTLAIPDDIHPLIFLTGKYKRKLKEYGDDLRKIYGLIRNQYIHKDEFEKQKSFLKKQVFGPIIEDAVLLPDFTFSIQDRIDLWQLVFLVLPHTYQGKDPEAVFNLYPRYDYAALVCLSYALANVRDIKRKKTILAKAVRGERNTPKMKQLFNELRSAGYGGEVIKRIKRTIEETRLITKEIPPGMERKFRQIEEDFNFGFSWAAFHLPQETAEKN
ncbi:hypothetical protein ACFL6I_09135 [candidate division KSB1 bacterium]